jgi:hypothetical protein
VPGTAPFAGAAVCEVAGHGVGDSNTVMLLTLEQQRNLGLKLCNGLNQTMQKPIFRFLVTQ